MQLYINNSNNQNEFNNEPTLLRIGVLIANQIKYAGITTLYFQIKDEFHTLPEKRRFEIANWMVSVYSSIHSTDAANKLYKMVVDLRKERNKNTKLILLLHKAEKDLKEIQSWMMYYVDETLKAMHYTGIQQFCSAKEDSVINARMLDTKGDFKGNIPIWSWFASLFNNALNVPFTNSEIETNKTLLGVESNFENCNGTFLFSKRLFSLPDPIQLDFGQIKILRRSILEITNNISQDIKLFSKENFNLTIDESGFEKLKQSYFRIFSGYNDLQEIINEEIFIINTVVNKAVINDIMLGFTSVNNLINYYTCFSELSENHIPYMAEEMDQISFKKGRAFLYIKSCDKPEFK